MKQSKDKTCLEGTWHILLNEWEMLKQQTGKESIFYLQIGHKLSIKLEQVLVLLKYYVSTFEHLQDESMLQNTSDIRSAERLFL